MAPVKPFWSQPSHPDIQEVIYGEDEDGYTSKSISKVSLPPFAVFTKMDFPPCTPAPEATYATVQTSATTHLNLNSDLLYINHSCEPTLIFDVQNLTILAGPNGLVPGQELTFFYPSTEWAMSQAFPCNCATPSCVGQISGAGQMGRQSLEGKWLSAHIRRLLEERESAGREKEKEKSGLNGKMVNGWVSGEVLGDAEINVRRGVTSREMSGEMGGDTL